jgi:DUF4097 and DUF4098 domain-containing protein YvlB
MKVSARFLSLLVACVAATGCGDGIDLSALAQESARGTFERTLTVSGAVDLSVRTGSGDIDIRTGPGDTVRIIGRVRAGQKLFGEDAAERVRQVEAAPPIQQSGTTIRIGDTKDDPRYRDVSISYELTVPANSRVNSQTGSGDQTIGSVDGPVRAQTGSGDIHIERAGGGLDAQTGSGDIRVKAVGGAMTLQTGSGDIDIRQTVTAGIEAQTGSGDVNLELPANAGFNLSARTGSGSIETAHPIQVEGKRRRNRVDGVVRGGGHPVNVTTGSGSIRIR